METLDEKAYRKRVLLTDLAWFKEATELRDDSTWDFKPSSGYLLACYKDNGDKLRYIVSLNSLTSCVVRHVYKIFNDEVECYKSIVEDRDKQVPYELPEV